VLKDFLPLLMLPKSDVSGMMLVVMCVRVGELDTP
jgi:hypothetical protein